MSSPGQRSMPTGSGSPNGTPPGATSLALLKVAPKPRAGSGWRLLPTKDGTDYYYWNDFLGISAWVLSSADLEQQGQPLLLPISPSGSSSMRSSPTSPQSPSGVRPPVPDKSKKPSLRARSASSGPILARSPSTPHLSRAAVQGNPRQPPTSNSSLRGPTISNGYGSVRGSPASPVPLGQNSKAPQTPEQRSISWNAARKIISIRVHVPADTTVKGLYVFRLALTEDETVVASHTWADVLAMRKRLKKFVPAELKMPKIRGRRVLPNSKDDFIERRRLFLEDFFEQCLMVLPIVLLTGDTFRNFFAPPHSFNSAIATSTSSSSIPPGVTPSISVSPSSSSSSIDRERKNSSASSSPLPPSPLAAGGQASPKLRRVTTFATHREFATPPVSPVKKETKDEKEPTSPPLSTKGKLTRSFSILPSAFTTLRSPNRKETAPPPVDRTAPAPSPKIQRSESTGALPMHVVTKTIPLQLEIMLQVLNHIEENCLYLEGVFRISGDRVVVTSIWNSFATGTPVMQGSKHELAGALKLYLQNAPESLIPPAVFEKVLFADEDPLTLKTLRIMVAALPQNSVLMLRALLILLWKISTRCDLNKMNTKNLGVCFGQTIMWSNNSVGMTHSKRLNMAHRQNEATEMMISEVEKLFEQVE